MSAQAIRLRVHRRRRCHDCMDGVIRRALLRARAFARDIRLESYSAEYPHAVLAMVRDRSRGCVR